MQKGEGVLIPKWEAGRLGPAGTAGKPAARIGEALPCLRGDKSQ